MKHALLAGISVIATSMLACGGASGTRPCTPTAGCPAGQACVIGRCAADDSASAINAASKRIVLAPESVHVVRSDDAPSPDGASVTLGGDIGPSQRLYVRFPSGDFPRGEVQRAFLVLERAEAASAGPDDITLHVFRLLEPWSREPNAPPRWTSNPSTERISDAIARAAGRGSLRIDVTAYALELSRESTAKKVPTFGLRIDGEGRGYGLAIATGALGGTGPRLEIYLQ